MQIPAVKNKQTDSLHTFEDDSQTKRQILVLLRKRVSEMIHVCIHYL